jgi:Tfp pilus assembly protein PilN
MRNIEASEWLKDPSLEILETKDASDGSSQFTLTAQQENPQITTQPDQQVAATPHRAGAQ